MNRECKRLLQRLRECNNHSLRFTMQVELLGSAVHVDRKHGKRRRLGKSLKTYRTDTQRDTKKDEGGKEMKRVFALVMLVCLLMGAQAFAQDFDVSVFENVSGISVSIDDMEGVGYIDMDSHRECFFDPGYSDYYYCSMYPSIRINNSGVAVLRWFIQFYGENWAFIDRMIIKVGDNRYTIGDIDIDREVVEHADVHEALGVVFSEEHLPFLTDFAEHCEDGPVKIRLCGDKYNVDFTMTDSMVKWLKQFITLCEEAGALNETYMNQIVSFNGITQN